MGSHSRSGSTTSDLTQVGRDSINISFDAGQNGPKKKASINTGTDWKKNKGQSSAQVPNCAQTPEYQKRLTLGIRGEWS
jgi:hypothetical protein